VPTLHTYIRRRGTGLDDPVDLNYLATGRHLQLDLQELERHALPKPDLMRGLLRCSTLAQASAVVALKLHGLYTREVAVDDNDDFFGAHPEFVGPPRIQLRAPRPARSSPPPTAKN